MYIDQEDREVMAMCHEHRHTTGITTTIGYFVPQEEARQMAVEKAIRERKRGELISAAMTGIAMLALIAMTVAGLLG